MELSRTVAAMALGCVSVLPATARAEIYRCEAGGKITYTDRPCLPGTAPAALPPLTPVAPEAHTTDLAKQYDRDAAAQDARERKARTGRSNDYADRVAQAAAVRKGVVEGRVVPGMTRDQVERILNEPDHVDTRNGIVERWTYISNGQRRIITFKDGVVTSETTRTSRSRHHR